MEKLGLKRNIIQIGFSEKESGFSLVELMIAMAVGLVVLGASYSVFTAQDKTLRSQEQIVDMQQNVRSAMDMITRDARMAGYNPEGASFSAITVSTSRIEIRADLDGNSNISGQEDTIYDYDPTYMRITRNIGAGAQTLAENIEQFTVTQINASLIRVAIRGRTASSDPTYKSNNGYRTYTLTSDISMRNPI